MKQKTDESSPRYQALLQLLRAADSVWNASRVFFERWHLGPSQFNVLNLLHLCPRGLSQTELSRELIMHRSNATGLVDRLEKRGWVKRKDADSDRRAWRVVLTPAGRKLVKGILPSYYDGAARIWGRLSARRVSRLIADLRQVAQRAERTAKGNGRSEPLTQSGHGLRDGGRIGKKGRARGSAREIRSSKSEIRNKSKAQNGK